MIQTIKYKCCGQIFAACMEPECYIDKDWIKNMRDYAIIGHKIEMMESGTVKFGTCKCSAVKYL